MAARGVSGSVRDDRSTGPAGTTQGAAPAMTAGAAGYGDRRGTAIDNHATPGPTGPTDAADAGTAVTARAGFDRPCAGCGHISPVAAITAVAAARCVAAFTAVA
jgi:hypothetical protein